jgi:hypothetical protein
LGAILPVHQEIIMHYKSKVLRLGAFWKVQIYFVGNWETMPDNFCTRAQARNAQQYWRNK